MTKKGNRATLIGITLLLVCGCLGFTSCGKAKKDDEKVININSSTGETTTEQDIKTVSQLYDLYINETGLDKNQIVNIANKMKPELEAMFGMNIDVNQIMDALSSVTPDTFKNGISPNKVAGVMFQHLPMLNWFTGDIELSEQQLYDKLNIYFKNASEPALKGLMRILKRFDEPWLNGDGNGKFKIKELSFPFLIINAMNNLEIPQGGIDLNFQLPVGQLETVIAKKALEQKLEQQVYGRYAANKYYSILSATDKKVENMQISLKFYLVTCIMRNKGFADGGKIETSKFSQIFKHINGIYSDQIYESFHIYDKPMMGGDEDGRLNVVELFNMTEDLTFSQKFNIKIEKDPTYVGNLFHIFPNVGEEIFNYQNLYDEKELSNEFEGKPTNYMASTIILDKPSFGGDGDGKINDYERMVGFAYFRLQDIGFDLCDTDQNKLIARRELRDLFSPKRLNIPMKDIYLDAFFMGIIPDKDASKFKLVMSGLKIKLGNKEKKEQSLNAPHFYIRMIKVLPTFLKGGIDTISE